MTLLSGFIAVALSTLGCYSNIQNLKKPTNENCAGYLM
jgi:hypothetical protein